ncbi:MAG: ATP-grasp fold amidoligase family protein [Eubacteriales bacterium]|jgi:hypothetical protein
MSNNFHDMIYEIATIVSPMLNTRMHFKNSFGRKLNLKHPQTLNEKVLWLKFNDYYENPIVKQCADKYRVREYIEKIGCGKYLNDLLFVYEKSNDIAWPKLPNQFALKLNVGCHCNLIVPDKSKLDYKKESSMINQWMHQKFYLKYSEMQYKDVKPYIIVERYLGDANGKPPVDYKFYCMNGKANSVMLCEDREGSNKPKFFFMDRNWNKLPYTREVFDYPDFNVSKPDKMDDMFEVAEKMAKGFPFVRVDLYLVNNKIYFGELMFTPAAGFDTDFKFKAPGSDIDTDTILGNMLKLPV